MLIWLVELANTTISVKESTSRVITAQAWTASLSILGNFTLLLNGDERCGSKPASNL
jgi:hypothetical protein